MLAAVIALALTQLWVFIVLWHYVSQIRHAYKVDMLVLPIGLAYTALALL